MRDEIGRLSERYERARVARFYDDWGDREWLRLETSVASRVNFELHRHYLGRFVSRGDRVLDAGAGSGRFTVELARLGAQVTVCDISSEQLKVNASKVSEAGLESRVEAWELLDILDLSPLDDESFDAVVCYGGPLSYVFDRADEALEELLRVTKKGGCVLLSVMGTIGGVRASLPAIVTLLRTRGEDRARWLASRELPASTLCGDRVQMYRWVDLKRLLVRHECTVEAASAANFLSVGLGSAVDAALSDDPELWDLLVEWERDVCAEEGALDGGTHIIAVVRRNMDGGQRPCT